MSRKIGHNLNPYTYKWVESLPTLVDQVMHVNNMVFSDRGNGTIRKVYLTCLFVWGGGGAAVWFSHLLVCNAIRPWTGRE